VPRLELPVDLYQQPGDRAPHSALAHRYQAKLFNLTGLQKLSQETVEVFWELRHLTNIKDGVLSGPEPELGSLLPEIHRLERLIIKIMQSKDLEIHSKDTTIYKLFGNAALIYVVIFIRQVPYPSSMLLFTNFLTARMRVLLDTMNLQTLQIKYPEMILWILIMGGIGGMGTENQGWYAKLLVDACLISGVRARTEIAFTLVDFLWNEQYFGPVSVGFWNDVAAAEGSKGRG